MKAAFFPLLLVQFYLLGTLIVYFFAPVQFDTHNIILFSIYIFSYHCLFIFGYCIGVGSFSVKKKPLRSFSLKSKKFYFIYFVSFLASLIFYKNLMMSPNIIPYNFLSDFTNGINDAGAVYASRMNILDGGYSGDRYLNIFYFSISFMRIVFIVLIVFFWQQLSFFQKTLSLLLILFQLSVSVVSGTNKPVFDVVIFGGGALIIYFAINYAQTGRFNFKSRWFFLLVAVFGLFGALYMFGHIMSLRGGDISYFSGTSPLGDIRVDPSMSESKNMFAYTLLWLNYYLVQGYYGFSLALSEPFTSTFGFGNSPFLLRQFEILMDVDLSKMTFQYKVDAYWGETAQWHSFYSHLANDFHFIGVAFVMLFLGFYLSRIWLTAIYYNSLYGKILLPLFILLIIFIPANNQVFGFMDTLSYFIVISVFWFFEQYKVRVS